MADEIKETKKKIWYLKQEIKKEEQGRDGWNEQLPSVIAMIEAGDTAEQWTEIKQEAEDAIAAHNVTLAKLHDELAALEAQLPKAPEPAAPKFDPEKHPLLRKTVEKPEVAKPVVFSVGDMIEAQWTDKAWYKAKIQTILGSASAPKYLVRFIEYDDSMTVDRDALRPTASKRKRDPSPAAAPSAPVTSTPHVISGPVSVNPNAQAAKKDGADEPKPKKKKTIGNTKQLEKRVNNWQDFNKKGVGKKLAKRESMFRSGTSVNSRVGFTGSGKGMTETTKRVRYDKHVEVDDEPDY